MPTAKRSSKDPAEKEGEEPDFSVLDQSIALDIARFGKTNETGVVPPSPMDLLHNDSQEFEALCESEALERKAVLEQAAASKAGENDVQAQLAKSRECLAKHGSLRRQRTQPEEETAGPPVVLGRLLPRKLLHLPDPCVFFVHPHTRRHNNKAL